MKSIKQIFKNNKKLMKLNEIKELISYCEELEDEIVDKKFSKQYSKEEIMGELIKEIHSSINIIIDDEKEYNRFHEIEKPNYKEAVLNLKKYLSTWGIDNNFQF